MLLTVMLAGHGLTMTLLLIMWRRMDKFDDRLTKIEHDMIEIKTILRMKECCMINDDRQMKKVE